MYTVIAGIFSIGLGDQFEDSRMQAYPLGTVVILPGNRHPLSKKATVDAAEKLITARGVRALHSDKENVMSVWLSSLNRWDFVASSAALGAAVLLPVATRATAAEEAVRPSPSMFQTRRSSISTGA